MFFFKSTEKKVDQILEMRVKLLEEKMRILIAENEALKKAALIKSTPCTIDKECCQSTMKN